MMAETSEPSASSSRIREKTSGSGHDPIDQNVEAILAFYMREEQDVSRSQRTLETIAGFVGQSLFLGLLLLFVGLWILANVFATQLGWAAFDPPPFAWLQAIISLGALVTATLVLIEQGRLAKLEKLRTQLELQVNLLAEQKTTKLIELMEELRRDLPMVKDRHDPEAAALQKPTDPSAVLAALDDRRETQERPKGASEIKEKP